MLAECSTSLIHPIYCLYRCQPGCENDERHVGPPSTMGRRLNVYFKGKMEAD